MNDKKKKLDELAKKMEETRKSWKKNKTLDLKDLSLANLNTEKDSLINIRAVSATTILIEPNSYWVLSTNPEQIRGWGGFGGRDVSFEFDRWSSSF